MITKRGDITSLFYVYRYQAECQTNEFMRSLMPDSESGACARGVYRVRLPKIELANDRTNCGFFVFSVTPAVDMY